MKAVCIILVIFVYITKSSSQLLCQANAQYNPNGPSCQPTCDAKADAQRACTAQTVRGCVCNPGYVRDPRGNCVLPKDCPILKGGGGGGGCGLRGRHPCKNKNKPENQKGRCGKDEKWSNDPCVREPGCQPACDDNWTVRQCTGTCHNGGCICKVGFVRDNTNQCVRPKNCNTAPHYPLG